MSSDHGPYAMMAELLDGLNVGLCLFDGEDRALLWNRTFFRLFPEHDGAITPGDSSWFSNSRSTWWALFRKPIERACFVSPCSAARRPVRPSAIKPSAATQRTSSSLSSSASKRAGALTGSRSRSEYTACPVSGVDVPGSAGDR